MNEEIAVGKLGEVREEDREALARRNGNVEVAQNLNTWQKVQVFGGCVREKEA